MGDDDFSASARHQALSDSVAVQITDLRSWSHPGSARFVIQTSAPVQYRAYRALRPDRIIFDIPNARPWIDHSRLTTREINDDLVLRVRISEPSEGISRIVFDLVKPADFSVTKLDAPERLVVELAPAGSGTEATRKPASRASPPSGEATLQSRTNAATWSSATPPAASAPAAASDDNAISLTRTLGLRINRIVIDPGHGGQDEGAMGPHNVREKDVVLDVALRLAGLVHSGLGAEVVMTRSTDTFVPLTERTAIANERKADLFLSIHANSSPTPTVAGTETYLLNLTGLPSALAVAARENAGSDRPVSELQDLVRSIALNDKIAESQNFASVIQSSMFIQAAASSSAARDRGVRRAPFIVLIGAQMPAALAEIGFLSNPRDEKNLNSPDYRQKIAESLRRHRGIALVFPVIGPF